jgi:hypothetical protein
MRRRGTGRQQHGFCSLFHVTRRSAKQQGPAVVPRENSHAFGGSDFVRDLSAFGDSQASATERIGRQDLSFGVERAAVRSDHCTIWKVQIYLPFAISRNSRFMILWAATLQCVME